jgi:Zn-dependent protease with chaperone function
LSRDELRFHAASVVAVAVGFWALALGLTALLLWVGFAIVRYASDYAAAGVAAWVLAGVLAYGFVPRGSSERQDPAPPLSATEHPRLHAFVQHVATSAGARPPDALYVFHQANAFAGSQPGRAMFARRDSVVGIGLPLLATLTESESRAVLAHEMGHHVTGDVRLGPWARRTRRAIARTVDRLEGSSFWLHLPFIAYAELFMRVSARVSRAQELAADALAARVAGPSVTASALRKTDVIGAAWEAYFDSEVLPLLARGRLPPLLAGWSCYWRAALTPDTIAFDALEALLKMSRHATDGDTHPVLAERIAALGDPAPVPDDASSALGLLDDVSGAEERVMRDLLVADAKLTPIAWEAVAEEVLLPSWRQAMKENEHALAQCDVRGIPVAIARWEQLAEATRRGPAVTSAAAEKARVVGLLGTCFAVALHDRGWRVEAPPGHAVRATRDSRSLEPFRLVRALAERSDAAAVWARMCDEHGL